MVKSLARMLLDSRKDRNMLYLQRKPIFLESHSEVDDNTLELSLNDMTKMLEHHENNKEKITEEEFRWIQRLARGLYYQKGTGAKGFAAADKSYAERSGVENLEQEEDSDFDYSPYADYDVFYKNQFDRIRKQIKKKESRREGQDRSESSISEINESSVEHITQRAINDPNGVTDIQ